MHALAALVGACLAVLMALACAQLSYADQTPDASYVVDPSTADGNAAILAEGTTNTLNAGRVWADKSVYDADAAIDGVTLANDSDFLVVFSALGSSVARTGAGFDGIPTSPIGGASDALLYTDPLGDYMEPIGDVTVVQFGQTYAYARSQISDGRISYAPVADQTLVNLSYGDADLEFKLSDILIDARKEDSGDRWVMHITIPSRALPLYLSILGFGDPDASGNQALKSFTTNAGDVSSSPLRIAYSIGIGQAYRTADGRLDFSKIPDEYQDAHAVQDEAGSKLVFHAGLYDDPTAIIAPDQTYGNAVVEIAPAPDNNFYYFQDHLVVYENGTPGTYNGNPVLFGSVSNPVTSLYDILGDPHGTFYVVRNYYRRSGTGGIHNAYEVVAYSGSDLANAVCYFDPATGTQAAGPGQGVVVATDIGCPCMGNVAKFRTLKASNPTDTARYSYYGDFIVDPVVVGRFSIEAHYGNNGVMSVSYVASDALQVDGEKSFQFNGSDWAPDASDYDSLQFQLLPSRNNPQGDPVAQKGIVASSDDSGHIVFNLGSYVQPGTYLYGIREVFPDTTIPGLTYDPAVYMLRVDARAGAGGKISLTTTLLKNGVELATGERLEFVNSYDTASIGVSVQGQIHLAGAPLADGMFSFSIEPVSAPDGGSSIACPMPASAIASNDPNGMLSFGNVIFAQPGQYVYRVKQLVPAPSAHASDYLYDRATYLVTVEVLPSSTGPLYATTTIEREGSGPVGTNGIVFFNQVVTPRLQVVKTQSVQGQGARMTLDVSPGDVIVYRVVIANPSGIAVRDVLVCDEVPAGLILADNLGSHASRPYLYEGRLYWIVKELLGGASAVFEFLAIVPDADAGSTWLNVAHALYRDLVDDAKTVMASSDGVLAQIVEATPTAPGPAPEPPAASAVAPVAAPVAAHAVASCPSTGDAASPLDGLLLLVLMHAIASLAVAAGIGCACLRRRAE